MADYSIFPKIDAALNGLSAVLLVTGRVLIARGQRSAHRAAMIAAFVTSSLFLVSYLYYHWPGHGGIVYFHGTGWIRLLYFTILTTHTILAIVNGSLTVALVQALLAGVMYAALGVPAAVIWAGATFIVAPGFNPAVVERCRDLGLVVIPGVSTPTEIEMALNAGIDVVKFFPSEALGGVRMLRALSAPYTKVRFIPTGGVNSENVAGYLSLPCVLAVGGSWMVAPELVRAKRFDEVTRLTEHAMNIVRSVRS